MREHSIRAKGKENATESRKPSYPGGTRREERSPNSTALRTASLDPAWGQIFPEGKAPRAKMLLILVRECFSAPAQFVD
jgi:hypothetical protein